MSKRLEQAIADEQTFERQRATAEQALKAAKADLEKMDAELKGNGVAEAEAAKQLEDS